MSRPATPVDFQRLFAAIPAATMVLRPDAPHFTIVAASDALLRHAGAKLEDLVGRSLFDAVPEPPDDANNGPGALRASLARVLATGEPDAMPVARYDVRRSDGVFEERYWMPVNAPLFGADGEIEFLVHRTDEATGFVSLTGSGHRQPEYLAHLDRAQSSPVGRKATAVFSQTALLQALFRVDGTLLRCNDLAFDQFGFRRDAIGCKLWDCGWWHEDPAHTTLMQQTLARVAAGEAISLRTQFRGPDGDYCHGDFRFAPVRNAAGQVVLIQATGQDRSEEQQMQAALAASEQRYRSLVSNISGMVYRVQASPPWKFTYVSEGVVRISGYPAAHFIDDDHAWGEIIHPDDAARVVDEVTRQAAEHQPLHVEYRIIHRDGSVRWVESRGQFVDRVGGVIDGTVFDIDDRKRIELALVETQARLRESEQRLRETIQISPALTWSAEASGRVDFISDASRAIFGVEPEAMVEQGWQDLIHPDHLARVLAIWQRSLATGTPYIVEAPLLCAGHRYRWIGIIGAARRGNDGSIVRWYGSATDIDEARSAQAHAENASRAKSAFLSTMSHEIRTPLNAVLGFAGLLAGTVLGPQQRDFVDSIRASGDHLLGVINDILDFSKLESGSLALELAPCDLRQTLESALDMVTNLAAAKGLALHYRIDDDVPPACIADQIRLRQVLANLLSNAVKFTSHGEIRVGISVRALEHTATRRQFEFRVSDTGIGIPATALDRLFRDFSQVDDSIARRFGGTGLGLAISKRLVQAHGGSIAVSSVVGVGSTFTFRIPAEPCALPVSMPVTGGEIAADSIAVPALRLLLAENNAVNRKLAQLMLGKLGYRDLDFAADGIEAVDAVARRRYDVVLMDIQMPLLDGLDATRRIRASIATAVQPQIIALTANALPEDRLACLAAGMDDYLVKPIDAALLGAALLRAAGRLGIGAS